MFNLERSIANWRRQMISGGIKSSAVLDELESHLREDVERRTHSGTPVEQAFEEAVKQVGRADELKSEFGKIEPRRPAVSPKLISRGCIAMGVFMVFTETWILFDAPMTEKVLGFVWLMLTGGYIVLLPRLNRNIWSGVRGWALRKAIAIICSFFTAAWIAVILLDAVNVIHFSLGVAVLPNLILWPLTAAAIATALVIDHATDWKALGLWSSTAEQSFEIAEAEALNFHHDFVGTEHLLLGLLGTKNSSVPGILAKMGVNSEAVRGEIEKIVGSFPKSAPAKTPSCTPRAKKALRLALQEAKNLRRNSVQIEHIFLGLILEGSGVAALVLKKLGVNPEKARAELLRTSR